MRDVHRILVSALILGGVLIVARFVGAVEWVEPTGIPPSANPPGFVWTRAPADAAQPGGQFNISGSGKIGAALDVVGKMTAGELCFGTECKKSWTEVADESVSLQSETPGTRQSGHLNISGTAIVGNLTATGCIGPVFRGRSTDTFQGNVGGAPGYLSANSKCNAAFPGSHMCATAEVLNSINCGAVALVHLAETDMWIANLAPSLPTPTNDCQGWTTAASDWWGIKWRFKQNTGGGAYAERCSTSLPFACCR